MYLDSALQSQAALEMYDELTNEETELTDSTEIANAAMNFLEVYYTFEFYSQNPPVASDQCLSLDSTSMCYNNTFQHSHPSDDCVNGNRIYFGFKRRMTPGDCVHSPVTLANLPLPLHSYPDDIAFPFNINPNDNAFVNLNIYDVDKVNFDKVEMYVAGSGQDPIIPEIGRNPPSGNRSIRINNTRPRYHVTTLERKFEVTEEDSIFSFSFALVFQNPMGHELHEQPYFTAVALDENGNIIQEYCFVSDPTDPRMDNRFLPGLGNMTFRQWDCVSFDLKNYSNTVVTIRFVAGACSLGAHFGYAYIADFCKDCSELPKIEPDPTIYVCPKEFPLEFCGTLYLEDSIYTLDTLYLEIRNGTTVYATLEYTSYDPQTGKVCFEVSEQLYKSLPNLGFDLYILAGVTHIANDHSSIITSASFHPNTPEDQNNDLLKSCCPEFVLNKVDYECESEELEFCGKVIFPANCDIRIDRLLLHITSGGQVVETIDIEADEFNEFCYTLPDSIYQILPDSCFDVYIEGFFTDLSYDISFTECSESFAEFDCAFRKDCCPEDADPLNISTSKFLCLVGTGYTNLVFDVVGRIPLSSFPEGFTYCDIPITFNGGHLDYNLIYTDSWFLHFSGLLHVTDTTQLLIHQPSGNYYMTGTLILCNENDLECEFDVELHFGMGQGSMCTEMEGIMCDNFLPDTSPYNPSGSAPPPNDGTNVYLPIKINVPYIGKIDDRDTCWIDQYWFEVYGVDPSFGGGTDLLHNSSISQQGSESSGLFAQFIVIDVNDWNSYSYIYVKFWNNCGDTCQLKNINVIPVIRGGMLIADDFNRLDEVKNVTVYPNPVRNELIVDYSNLREEAEIRMFDRSGRIVNSSRISGQTGRTIIPVSQLLSGIYLIEITDPGLERRVFVIMKE